jgi:hypothetical protein
VAGIIAIPGRLQLDPRPTFVGMRSPSPVLAQAQALPRHAAHFGRDGGHRGLYRICSGFSMSRPKEYGELPHRD